MARERKGGPRKVPVGPPPSTARKKPTPSVSEEPKPKKPRPRKPGPSLPPDEPGGPPLQVPPGDPRDRPLTDEEQRFVDEWGIDQNPARACRRIDPAADHRTARRRAEDFMHRPWVAHELRAARAAQRLRCRVDADMALEELCRIAFSDIMELFDPATHLLRLPGHIPLEIRRSIAKVRISRERRTEIVGNNSRTIVTDSVIEYTFWNKLEALGRLVEHLGLKTALPPLQVLLSALPPELAGQVAHILNPPTPLGPNP